MFFNCIFFWGFEGNQTSLDEHNRTHESLSTRSSSRRSRITYNTNSRAESLEIITICDDNGTGKVCLMYEHTHLSCAVANRSSTRDAHFLEPPSAESHKKCEIKPVWASRANIRRWLKTVTKWEEIDMFHFHEVEANISRTYTQERLQCNEEWERENSLASTL